MRLPRVRAEEVGFGEQGRRLGMPQRPNWRGVVRGRGGWDYPRVDNKEVGPKDWA